MTSIQLKNILIDKIYNITDEKYLLAIKKILDCAYTSDKVYHLSEKQKSIIKEGKQQISEGKYISNQELEKEEDLWLNE